MTHSLDPKVTRQLISARYLLQLATDQAGIEQEAASFAAISLLQDALESFLVIAADYLNAPTKLRTDFPNYLDLINERLPDRVELPFRARLLQINKVRVNAKHDGVKPDHTELLGYLETAREFLSDAARKVFGIDFWSISLVSLLNDGEAKTLLERSEEALRSGEHADALVFARKAFFLEFEKSYDIKVFEREDAENNWFLSIGCYAPHYARSAQYIENSVECPFDYIVMDHAQVDANLAKLRIDSGTWWNIWRLSPNVYRHSDGEEWAIKNEPTKFENPGLENRAQYVFEATVHVIRKKQEHHRSLRWVASNTDWIIRPKANAPIYKKASTSSEIIGYVPEEVAELRTQYSTPGLNENGEFWFVLDFHSNPDTARKLLQGYIRVEDVYED